MTKPVLVCAADLAHLPEVRAQLEDAFELRMVRPATPEALARALPEADAYFATLETRLTDALIARAQRLKAIATPSTGLDHLDLDAAARHGVAVLGLKDERDLLDCITATAELAWALVPRCAARPSTGVQDLRHRRLRPAGHDRGRLRKGVPHDGPRP